ncbi:tetratricopeptide repeat protein [Lacibacter luteus]|uniref:Tetratricopeptide repeat protein n=1 Tax=Lacibacter luteus TaxID=2508719 RepID=A0A4Q1CJ98_9BACT|nr:tetratricopeptide repeat protein [Lacibacter luteus]RXK60633.1 tetratricopeptide repeat protein [Lacibacter luteus]
MYRRIYLFTVLALFSATTQHLFAQQNAKGSSEEEVAAAGGAKTTHAIIVGVSDYDAPRLQLNVADKDAALFARFLLETKTVSKENLQLLLNKKANSAAVNAAIRSLLTKKMKPGDEVIFYFSGHGDIQKSKDTANAGGYIGYLLCSDVNIERAYTGAQGTLSFKDLNDVVSKLSQSSIQVSIVLDACHSGQTVNEEGANLLSESALTSFRNTIRYLSCGANQRSFESELIGHGYFTFYLVHGMMGAADNSPLNNKINVNELNMYVYNNVFQESKELQEPNIGASSGGKVVMTVSPAMKLIAFDSLRLNAMQEIKESNTTARSIVVEPNAGLTTLTTAQQDLLNKLNSALKNEQHKEAITFYTSFVKQKSFPADWLRFIKLKLVQQLSIDPQQAVNTVLLGNNNQPSASYFMAAAEKSKLLLSVLDKSDYEHKIYYIYARYLESYSYLRGKNYKMYPVAKKLLQEALAAEQDAAFVLHALGLVAEYQDNFPLAEKYYRQAIELIPTWTYPRSSLGNALRSQNRVNEAIAVFKEVIKLAPAFSWPYNNLANVYYDLKRYNEAEQLYNYSIKIDSVDAATEYSNLGLVFKDRGNIKKAETFFTKAIHADSNMVYAYHHLAELYKKINAKQTNDLLIQSVNREPYFAEGLTELADYYREGPLLQEWKLADSLYQAAISNNPYYTWAYAGKAWGKAQLKDTAEAIRLFKESIRINEDKPSAYAYYGRYFQLTKNYKQAISWYKKGLAVSPWYWENYEWMHESWLKLNKPDSALAILQQAQNYFGQNPDLYNLLGNFHYANGNFTEAALQYAKALTADSSYANAYGNLAYTSLEINDFANAVRYFKKAHDNDPLLFSIKDISLVLIDKADNLLLDQKQAEALSLLSLATTFIPASQSDLYFKTASLYYINGEYKKAIPLLEQLLTQQDLTAGYRYRFMQLLGCCKIDEGNYSEAAKLFEASLTQTSNPSYLGLAASLFAAGQKEKAAEWLTKENKNNPNWQNTNNWSRQYSKTTIQLLQQLKQLP